MTCFEKAKAIVESVAEGCSVYAKIEQNGVYNEYSVIGAGAYNGKLFAIAVEGNKAIVVDATNAQFETVKRVKMFAQDGNTGAFARRVGGESVKQTFNNGVFEEIG